MLLYFCCLLKGLSLTEAKLPCYFLPSWNWDVLKLLSLYGIIIFDFLSFFILYTGMHIVITYFLKRIYICHVFKEVYTVWNIKCEQTYEGEQTNVLGCKSLIILLVIAFRLYSIMLYEVFWDSY